jgi:hypothetical protein
VKKIITIIFLLSAIQSFSQNGRYSIQLYGGGSLALLEENLHTENVNRGNSFINPRFSFTENIRVYFGLTKSVQLLVGYGHARTGANPTIYFNDSLFNVKRKWGINQIRDFINAGEIGINFRALEKPKLNINTSFSFSLGESPVTRGYASYVNFGDSIEYSSLTFNGSYPNWNENKTFKAIKFSLGAEYKLGELKANSITFDLFFNHGFNQLGSGSFDQRIDNKYAHYSVIDKGSYIAFTLGFKKYFQLTPQ